MKSCVFLLLVVAATVSAWDSEVKGFIEDLDGGGVTKAALVCLTYKRTMTTDSCDGCLALADEEAVAIAKAIKGSADMPDSVEASGQQFAMEKEGELYVGKAESDDRVLIRKTNVRVAVVCLVPKDNSMGQAKEEAEVFAQHMIEEHP